MINLEITEEVKNAVQINLFQLEEAICNHQTLVVKLKQCPDADEDLLKNIKNAEDRIKRIGIEQKQLLGKLREECKIYQKIVKTESIRSTLDERTHKSQHAINRARKQYFFPRSHTSPNSVSDDCDHRNSPPSSPPALLANNPHDLTQTKFLAYFKLGTHETYKEMLSKRAERKRRSTANPQFLYARGWDYWGPQAKKKRKFLYRPPSPPQTRGRKRLEQNKSPLPGCSSVNYHPKSVTNGDGPKGGRFAFKPIVPAEVPEIPHNLPNGLTIERVGSSGSSSPELKPCTVCKQTGGVSICESCSLGFHITCHNRPFSRTPKECPRCLNRESRRPSSNGSSNSGLSVAYASPTEISEKLQIKQQLQEKRDEMVAGITQLQNRHSELTISLKTQEAEKQKLQFHVESAESKVSRLIEIIESVRHFSPPEEVAS